ncbi:MAG: type II toxin-antitoxin system RelE/ParE family toxin [Cruoricaptor ignavus]|nr:type II toxin-antitoxin system RelE/ParE family toxin [Cruoricaptor ignavus]
MKYNFEVELLPEVVEFLNNLSEKPREKIYYNIRKAQMLNDNELFKKLNDVIWEFRTLYNGNSYRLFSFWDIHEKSYVIATHGIIKKTQKTPKKEIEKAEKIRLEYLRIKYNEK